MNKGKEHALEIDLGHDQRGNRIIWDTKDSPTLTVTGHEGRGKTTFADRIMLEAQRDGAAPVTPLIRKSNHSHATTMIVNTEADMRTPFGWGAYEDNTGAVRQLRTDIDGKETDR